MAVLETEPQHSGSGGAWQRGRTPASTARSPPPSRLAPAHLTERQQLALALEESRRAAAAAARKGLLSPMSGSTSGSDSESEDAYSSAQGAGPAPAQRRRRPTSRPAAKRRRIETASPAKSGQTDVLDSLDSTVAPSLAHVTPPRSGECTPATASPLRADDEAAQQQQLQLDRSAHPAALPASPSETSGQQGAADDAAPRFLNHRTGSGSSTQEALAEALAASPRQQEADDAFSVRAQRLALRQAVQPKRRLDAAAAGDDAAAQRPKKQRQPQRRRPAAQSCGGPAAAADAAPADGLDPQLVARLAAQRQQKFGCCGGQKGVARTSSGLSPPADKERLESQPQPQAQQQQQRPSQQQRSLLASVSLQEADLFAELASTPRPKPLRIKACTSWSQQPASPAAVKLEPGKPEATASAAAVCAARLVASPAIDDAKAASTAAADPASSPPASAAGPPPAQGVRIPVPGDAPDMKQLSTPQPTAAATELPSGSPAVQQQPLPPNPEPAVSAEAKEDAAFLAAAQAAASAPMSTDTAAADAALLPPADCGAAVQPSSPCAGSGNGSAPRRIRFAKQHSLPNAVGKASGSPSPPLPPLQHALSCRAPSASAAVSGDDADAAAASVPRSPPVPGPKARRPRGPSRSQSGRNGWVGAEPGLRGLPSPRARRLRSAGGSSGGGSASSFFEDSGFGGSKEPLVALSFERQPSWRRTRARPGALLSACSRLASGEGFGGRTPTQLVPSQQPAAVRQPPPESPSAPCPGGGCSSGSCGCTAAVVVASAAAAKALLQARHDAEGLRLQRAMDCSASPADAGSRCPDAPPAAAAVSRRACTCKWARGRGCGGCGCGTAAAAAAGKAATVAAGCGVLMASLQGGITAAEPGARRDAAALRAQQRQLNAAGAWDDLSTRHTLEAFTLEGLAAWLAA